jgi:glycosyltransferase involved in cell wall biosynthesis
MPKRETLSIILPIQDQAHQLPLILMELENFLSKHKFNWELIVVNDGSDDNSKEIVKRFIKLIKRIKLVSNERSRGWGIAVKQGMQVAKGEWRIILSTDQLSYIEELDKVLPLFKKRTQVVLGYQQPHTFNSFVFTTWCRFLFLIKGLKSAVCPIQCYRREVVERVFPLVKSVGRGFNLEALALTQRMKYQIREVGVTCKKKRDRISLIDCYRTLSQTFIIRRKLWNNNI